MAEASGSAHSGISATFAIGVCLAWAAAMMALVWALRHGLAPEGGPIALAVFLVFPALAGWLTARASDPRLVRVGAAAAAGLVVVGIDRQIPTLLRFKLIQSVGEPLLVALGAWLAIGVVLWFRRRGQTAVGSIFGGLVIVVFAYATFIVESIIYQPHTGARLLH